MLGKLWTLCSCLPLCYLWHSTQSVQANPTRICGSSNPQVLEDQTTIILLLPVHTYIYEENTSAATKDTTILYNHASGGMGTKVVVPKTTHHAPPYILLSALTAAKWFAYAAKQHSTMSSLDILLANMHTTMLWSGNNIVSGHVEDIYLGWSQIFGISQAYASSWVITWPITLLHTQQ